MAKTMKKKQRTLVEIVDEEKRKNIAKTKHSVFPFLGFCSISYSFLQVECVEMIRRIPWVYPYFEKETLCRVLNLNVRVCRKS